MMLRKLDPVEPRKRSISKPVFFGAAGVIVTLVAVTMVAPKRMERVFSWVNDGILSSAAWLYALAVTAFLVTCILVATSRFGKIRLGPDHSEPDYGFASWFAMLFSAGMGIGLMFFGVAEPLQHFAAPPDGEGGTPQAAKLAMQLTYFHWGLHAWAIYALVGLILAYFGFRRQLPLSIRSALYPLIGDRIYGPIGHIVDIFAVIGILFGVATSLGFGSAQVNAGLGFLFGVPINIGVQTLLIALITLAATISVVSGLDKGIKRLSELNLVLAGILLLFVIIAGPTALILSGFVENLGNYLDTLIDRSLQLDVYGDDRAWIGSWTIFYWGWWISWSPFVGMFIARVSRGRTIREFILGVLLVPCLMTFLWMTAFGNTALSFGLDGSAPALMDAVANNVPLALFELFELMPLGQIASLIAVCLVVTFFVTSSDSGSLVIDIITAGGRTETPVWQRVFWAVMEGLVAAGLLYTGGLGALQTAALASALPFTIVIIVALGGLLKGLSFEHYRSEGAERAATIVPIAAAPLAGAATPSWRTRLNAMLSHPDKRRITEFIESRAKPALAQVAEAIRAHDSNADAHLSDDGTELNVSHGGEADFRFAVRARSYLTPAFSLADEDPDDPAHERFFRAEVFLNEGGQGFDIYGYSTDEIIHEVLNQYNKHMHFLHLVHG